MKIVSFFLLAAFLSTFPESCSAHNMFGDMNGLKNGAFHPVVVLEHALFLVSIFFLLLGYPEDVFRKLFLLVLPTLFLGLIATFFFPSFLPEQILLVFALINFLSLFGKKYISHFLVQFSVGVGFCILGLQTDGILEMQGWTQKILFAGGAIIFPLAIFGWAGAMEKWKESKLFQQSLLVLASWGIAICTLVLVFSFRQ